MAKAGKKTNSIILQAGMSIGTNAAEFDDEFLLSCFVHSGCMLTHPTAKVSHAGLSVNQDCLPQARAEKTQLGSSCRLSDISLELGRAQSSVRSSAGTAYAARAGGSHAKTKHRRRR